MQITEGTPVERVFTITVSLDELRVIEHALYTAEDIRSGDASDKTVFDALYYGFFPANGITSIDDSK